MLKRCAWCRVSILQLAPSQGLVCRASANETMKLIEEQYMQLIFTPCITSCSCDQLIMTYRLPQTKSNGYINHNSDYFPHRTVTLGPYIRSSVSASTNQPLPVFTTTPPAFQSPSPSNSPRPKQPYPPLSPHPCSRPLPSCSHHFHP